MKINDSIPTDTSGHTDAVTVPAAARDLTVEKDAEVPAPRFDAVVVDTATVDSVAADSIVAPVDVVETQTIVEVIPPAWEDGLLPVDRPGHAGHDQGIVASIVLIMLAVALSFNAARRVLGNMVKRLSNNHIRDGFETDTGAEKRTTLLMLLMTVIFTSILFTAGLSLAYPASFDLDITTTGRIAGLVTAYFVFQYAIYQTIGYTFTNDEGRVLWVRGFTASMILLGVGLVLPGITVLFYPDLMLPAVAVAAALYVVARVLFISRGFRIFYTNIASLIYFILYLCSLEFVPVCVILYLSTQILQ